MDSLTRTTKKYDGEDAAHPRFMTPLVRDSRNAVSGLPGVASPNTFKLYSGSDEHRYQAKYYTIKVAASQHFLILSINIKVGTLGATAGSELTTATRLTPNKLCVLPGFFIRVN
jgi:hypothetical protein